jgi:hypothetical protein
VSRRSRGQKRDAHKSLLLAAFVSPFFFKKKLFLEVAFGSIVVVFLGHKVVGFLCTSSIGIDMPGDTWRAQLGLVHRLLRSLTPGHLILRAHRQRETPEDVGARAM